MLMLLGSPVSELFAERDISESIVLSAFNKLSVIC